MIIGIDPGLSGAIALLDNEGLAIFDMPTFEITVNKKKRRVLDEARLVTMIRTGLINQITFKAIVENVHSMPEQGVASSFKFGLNYGVIRGILAALEIPVTYVESRTWKKYFKLTGEKDMSRQRASELMPKHSHFWPLKKHDGRAEAALLAYYGTVVK